MAISATDDSVFKCVFLTFLLNVESKQNTARSMWLMENAVDGLHKD